MDELPHHPKTEHPNWEEPPLSRKTSGLALASLILGLLLVPGIPAILVGISAVRAIHRADGRLRGRWCAVAGILLGGLSTVLLVIGLAALIVNHLREVGHRDQCKFNLARIGMAVSHYHDEHKVYPLGRMAVGQQPPEECLSWLVEILPYLGPEIKARPGRSQVDPGLKTYQTIDRDQGWRAEANREAATTIFHGYICPSSSETSAESFGLTHYVGIAGVGRDAAKLPKNHPDAGFFGYDRILSLKDIQALQSATMMAAETMTNNGPWIAGGPSTVRGIDLADGPPIGFQRPFGGLHPGGVHVLFVDGSVQFVMDKIDPALWESEARIGRE